jgi:hypothetical protein
VTRRRHCRGGAAGKAPPLPLDDAATGALRGAEGLARRGGQANTTCRPTSCSTTPRWPRWRASSPTLDALAGISGVGAKKLEAYGAEILRVLARPTKANRPPTTAKGGFPKFASQTDPQQSRRSCPRVGTQRLTTGACRPYPH